MSINAGALEEAIAAQHSRLPYSGVIFVREQAEILFAQGYGVANRAEQIPNTVHTRLGMASGKVMGSCSDQFCKNGVTVPIPPASNAHR